MFQNKNSCKFDHLLQSKFLDENSISKNLIIELFHQNELIQPICDRKTLTDAVITEAFAFKYKACQLFSTIKNLDSLYFLDLIMMMIPRLFPYQTIISCEGGRHYR